MHAAAVDTFEPENPSSRPEATPWLEVDIGQDVEDGEQELEEATGDVSTSVLPRGYSPPCLLAPPLCTLHSVEGLRVLLLSGVCSPPS